MPSNCQRSNHCDPIHTTLSTSPPAARLHSITHMAAPAGRGRVGQRVRQICQVLQDIGPSGRASIGDYLPDIDPRNVGKYCARAVAMGLLSVEHGLGHKANYSVYTAVANWRELADKRGARIAAATASTTATPKTRWSGIASIFQLGAQ